MLLVLFESWKKVDGSWVFWKISPNLQAKPLPRGGEQNLCLAPPSFPTAGARSPAPPILGLCRLLELPAGSGPTCGDSD